MWLFSGNISWGLRRKLCCTRTLAIHLSRGLPSFSSSYSLVVSCFRINGKHVKRGGGISPGCLWNYCHRPASVLLEYFEAQRNTIITLSVPLPVLARQKRVLSWWGCVCHSEPAQHSHHLHPPRELLQCCPRWNTPSPPSSHGRLLGSRAAGKPCPLSLEKEMCHLCFPPDFIWFSDFNTFKKSQHPTF